MFPKKCKYLKEWSCHCLSAFHKWFPLSLPIIASKENFSLLKKFPEARGMAQVVVCLPWKCEALSSNPSTGSLPAKSLQWFFHGISWMEFHMLSTLLSCWCWQWSLPVHVINMFHNVQTQSVRTHDRCVQWKCLLKDSPPIETYKIAPGEQVIISLKFWPGTLRSPDKAGNMSEHFLLLVAPSQLLTACASFPELQMAQSDFFLTLLSQLITCRSNKRGNRTDELWGNSHEPLPI
jgi:hypothetical protein